MPSALKAGTVIRAIPEESLYSVRVNPTGKGFRCACIWERAQTGVASRPPLRACNRADCLKLAHFTKGAGLSFTGDSAFVGGRQGAGSEGSQVEEQSEQLLCAHLSLVKEALEAEEAGERVVEEPLVKLCLKEHALLELIDETVLSGERAEALMEEAMAFQHTRGPSFPAAGRVDSPPEDGGDLNDGVGGHLLENDLAGCTNGVKALPADQSSADRDAGASAACNSGPSKK